MLLDHRGCQDLGHLRPPLGVDLQQLAHEVDEVGTVLAWGDGLEAASHDLGAQLCHRPGFKGNPATPHKHGQQADCSQQGPEVPPAGRLLLWGTLERREGGGAGAAALTLQWSFVDEFCWYP